MTVSRAAGSVSLSWTWPYHAQGYEIDCATRENNVTGAYTRCADVDTANVAAGGTINVTISSWTAGGNNYTIDDAKTYDLRVRTTNAWGHSTFRFAPLIHPNMVSNLASTKSGDANFYSGYKLAVAFSTGANAGGYVLKSVTVPLKNVSGRGNMTLTLHAMEGSGQYSSTSAPSDTVLATLSGTPPTAGTYTDTTWTCSGSGCNLSDGKTYFVVVASIDSLPGYAWAYASTETETAAPPGNGWSVGFGHYKSGANDWGSWSDWQPAEIVFATDLGLAASNVTATGATLTIGGYSGAWWYQGGKTGGALGTCTSVPSGNSATLTGLDSLTQYDYKVYSAATCASASLFAITRFNTRSSGSGPSFSVTNVTQATARLTLSGRTGGWWYDTFRRDGNAVPCTAGPSNFILNVSNLTADTAYTYRAFSDNACATQIATTTFRTLAAPQLTVSNVAKYSATLSLSNHSGHWWYEGSNRSSGHSIPCTKSSVASVDLTGLTSGGARYAFAAYSASGCAQADRLDDVSFRTPFLTVSGVTATGATLTIANHTDAWYYKHTNTGATCDGPVAAGTSTKALTGLTAGTSYTYSAYSDSTCTTGNLLATAAAFTTLTTLTVSNVGTTTARITIAGHTGQWWYKADSGPHTTCQGPVAAGTSYKDLTGLTAGSFYVYSAYSATGCADASLLPSAGVATSVTVSNLGAANTGTNHPIDNYAQGFTTGDADATLLSATVQIADAFGSPNFTVSLRAAQSNGKPATTNRATLTGTAGKGQRTFTCVDGGSNDCSLDANTKYFIYVSGSSGYLSSTDSNTETLQPANNGWSIEDAMRRQTSFDLRGDGKALKIKVEAIPHESLTASNVTATGATLTIKRHLGDWWYKSTTTGQTTCTSAGSGTSVSLTLTAGTSYTFSAYSDSTCTTTNLLATAAQFTTQVSVSTLGGSRSGHHEVGHYQSAQQQAAQGFTTGSNTGGYTLSSIDIEFNATVGSPTNLVVTLHRASGSNPDTTTTLAELNGDNSPSSAGTYTYTCSGSGCNLDKDTPYFVLLKALNSTGTSYYYADLTSAAETKQPSTNNNWSIANNARENLYGTWLSPPTPGAYKMKVSAVPK